MNSKIAFRTSLAGGLGAAAASALGSLCCIPAAVAFLGVGGAAAGALLSPYRAPLALVSVVLVGTALWIRSARRGEACAVPAAEEVGNAREAR